ncbi:hypothetical protein [Streptomyces sp. NBC_01304]|uniref:hypothetical protein n=1 Tax=Streptomyces sp. NBC_01304 TaxID=2903818 RepID=UPI002E143750|nr:hypothetical protein OG430_48840 [Streptomyces sp. NBC_01304]
METNTLPTIRFACITDPSGQHAFFCATRVEDFDQLLAAYAEDDELSAVPFEFTDPQVVSATQEWVAYRTEGDHRPMVMVGSIEDGYWVNWNLSTVPLPPVPAYPAF